MRVISVPEDRSLYPKLVGETVMAAKLQLGRTRLSVNYNKVPGGILPVLVVDFYNPLEETQVFLPLRSITLVTKSNSLTGFLLIRSL